MTAIKPIDSDLIQALLQGAYAAGLSTEEVLTAAEVSPRADNHNKPPPLTLDEFGRVVRTVFALLDDEASGFLSRPLKPGTFAMMCHATITCPNLRRALWRSIRFMLIVSEELRFDLKEQGEEACLTLTVDNPRQLDNRYFIVSLFTIWIRWFSWMIDKTLLLERVYFTFAEPDYRETLGQIFPCRHYFNQTENGIVFNRRFLEFPLAQNQQSLTRFLAQAPDCLMTAYRTDNSLTATVRQILKQTEHPEALTFEAVAEQLHMSTQTLRRRLKEEGNVFQDIKNTLRRDTAIYHLSRRQTPILQIAELTGFSEPSAFNRAFKKWTGMTPGAYRAKRARR